MYLCLAIPQCFLNVHCVASFPHCPQSGQFNEDMIPTVGFNMRKVNKGNVTIKVRDFCFGRERHAIHRCVESHVP